MPTASCTPESRAAQTNLRPEPAGFSSGAAREQGRSNTYAAGRLVWAFRLSGRGDDASAGWAGSLPGAAVRKGGKNLFREGIQSLQNGQAGPGGVAGEFAQ